MGWDILWILVSVLVIDRRGRVKIDTNVMLSVFEKWYMCLEKCNPCVWEDVIRLTGSMRCYPPDKHWAHVWTCSVLTTNDKWASVVARCTRFTVYSWITQLCLLSFFENLFSILCLWKFTLAFYILKSRYCFKRIIPRNAQRSRSKTRHQQHN